MADPTMSLEYVKLAAEVAEDSTLMGSAAVLINGLADQIRALAEAATDLAALQAAIGAKADELDAGAQDLAAAVVANTPTA